MSTIRYIRDEDGEQILSGPFAWARLLSSSAKATWGISPAEANPCPPGAVYASRIPRLIVVGPMIVELGDGNEPFPGSIQGSRLGSTLYNHTVSGGAALDTGAIACRDSESLGILLDNESAGSRIAVFEALAGTVWVPVSSVSVDHNTVLAVAWGPHGYGKAGAIDISNIPFPVPEFVRILFAANGTGDAVVIVTAR